MMKRAEDYSILQLLPILVFAVVTTVSAQSAANQITLGNKAYDARNALRALEHYDIALASDPKNYEALCGAARAGVEVGEYDPQGQKMALYKTAEQRARLAVQVNSAGTEGHFVLALVLGRTALAVSVRDRVKYVVDIHDQALACLQINPKHPGCLHTMGLWNAEGMRLNRFSRIIARRFLGGKVLGEASWDEAQRYLTAAVTNAPRHIIHRLDLGRVYVDRGMKAEARAQFQAVIDGELLDYNDLHYKAEAAQALQTLTH